MSTTRLPAATAVADRAGLRLLRAQPRGDDRLLLALHDGTREVAGQWYDDPARCRHVAERTRAVATTEQVRVHQGRLLVQRDGADRRLPALGALVRDGAELVAHRPERRGVVRRPDGRFSKIVPHGRAAPLAATLRQAAGWAGVCVPEVLHVGEDVVDLAPLPGRTLHASLTDPHSDPVVTGRAVGAAVRRLHDVRAPEGLPVHDATAELDVTARWLHLAAAHGLGPVGSAAVTGTPAVAGAELPPPPQHLVVLHRDLHDKQLLLHGPDGSRGVGMLDLDLLALGDPALDLANLLVHLELRCRQGLLTPARARTTAAAVVDGYDPTPRVRAALAWHGRLVRWRLAAVYAFRPVGAAAAHQLLDEPLLLDTPHATRGGVHVDVTEA